MRLLSNKEVADSKKQMEAADLARRMKIATAVTQTTREFNETKLRVEVETKKLTDAHEKEKEELSRRKKELQGEVAALESRRRDALKPITAEKKAVAALTREVAAARREVTGAQAALETSKSAFEKEKTLLDGKMKLLEREKSAMEYRKQQLEYAEQAFREKLALESKEIELQKAILTTENADLDKKWALVVQERATVDGMWDALRLAREALKEEREYLDSTRDELDDMYRTAPKKEFTH